MIKKNEKQLAKLETADWGSLQAELTLYAEKKVRAKKWRSGAFMPKGLEATDLVSIVITKTFNAALGQVDRKINGFRSWDETIHPNLVDHLKSGIDSEVSKLVRCEEHRKTNYSPGLSTEEAQKLYDDSVGAGVEGKDEDASVRIELDEIDEFKRKLYEALKSDEESTMMLKVYEELSQTQDVVKPQQAATVLGWKIDFISNVKKRVRRAAEKVRLEMEGKSHDS